MRKRDLKVLFGVLAASAFLALSASAQPSPLAAATTTPAAAPAAQPAADVAPSRCPAVASDPSVPDGATASDRSMLSANDAYQAWARALRASADCRRAEYDELSAQRRAKAQAHDALNARLREVSTRWAEQRNLYCGRPRRQCRAITPEEVSSAADAPETPPCSETLSTPEPTIPDGATANQQAMDAADTAYLAWGHEVQRNLQCRKTEFDHLTAIATAREAEHGRLAQRLADVSTAWEAQQTIYCARPRKQCQATETPAQ
jgi:hypothetical protein